MKTTNTSKVSSTRAISLVGKVKGEIVRLPLICVRKNCVRPGSPKESKMVRSGKFEILGMVSHPGLYKSKTARYVKAWCHPFRNPDDFFGAKKPRILLSESDFVDPVYVRTYRKRAAKWDFFFFTMGGKKGSRRKGLSLFVQLLPALSARNLRGLVINYTSKSLHLTREEKKIWRSHKNCFNYQRKSFSPRKVARTMSRCRFGIFPNQDDCSPLLLVESLIRDVPVLVNEDIWGGWKYVNDDTGVFFNPETTQASVDRILDGQFKPQERFLSEYGFYSSAKRLAHFGRKHFKAFKHCRLACFEGLAHILKRYL